MSPGDGRADSAERRECDVPPFPQPLSFRRFVGVRHWCVLAPRGSRPSTFCRRDLIMSMVRARHTDRCTSCTSDRVRSDCLHQMHCQSHSACHALRQSVPLKGTKDYALAAISAVGALASAYCAYNGAGDGTFPATYYVNFTMIAFGMYAIGFFLVPTMLIDMNFNARTDYYHEFIARISGFNMLLIICKSLRAITDSPLQPPCNPFGFVIESLNGALCIACRAHLQCRHRHRLPNVRHLGGRHRPSRTHLCSAQAQPEANPRGSYASSLFVLDWRCPGASRHLLRHTTVDASSSRCACSSSCACPCPCASVHVGCDARLWVLSCRVGAYAVLQPIIRDAMNVHVQCVSGPRFWVGWDTAVHGTWSWSGGGPRADPGAVHPARRG